MNKSDLRKLVDDINKITLENRKKPGILQDLAKNRAEEFVKKSGFSREGLIEKLENRLEDSQSQNTDTMVIEILRKYV